MGNSDAAAGKIDAKKVGQSCGEPDQNRKERPKPVIGWASSPGWSGLQR
jgi:hypothetical protein